MEIDGEKSKKRRRVYEDHKPLSELMEGIKHGVLHQVEMISFLKKTGISGPTI